MKEFQKVKLDDYLDTPEKRAAYLEEAVAANDPDFLKVAIGDVAKAVGMAKIAEAAGLNRANLYRSFSEEGNPTMATLIAVLDCVGLKLSAVPK